ncbi:Dyp-type peroxidase [Paracoccus versutus]|uniref:Iron-dependent peroxidase n=1 Tax=Paracoccus versutus TaxID=34007 RepID=A0AAQ0HC57_PARVE|nr:Dyp-type peroxidase [Paracoccus versutus]KGJ11966.1 peroxidase [Paracoccus versutus]REG26993.1 putative iron-dependent peroxidase [Paracoccus versutus]WEJ78493.1 Dyp-type peroxidase [Paracoccus versutus]
MTTIASQPADASLTANAIFLTLSLHEGEAALQTFRDLCADLPGLVRAVGFRNAAAGLSCVIGIGAALWDRLDMGARPQGLHPFRELAGVHRAPATPGDILFHIRAERPDFCFELASQVMARLGPVATVEDETQGFKFFDNRDLLGFVDGTENPSGADRMAAVFIGAEDEVFAGGSYVIVQKYLHDLARWAAMTVEAQERVIGRRKLSDIEFPDAEKASFAHNVLTNISDAQGNPLQILRDNMPFGSPARGAFGTYFIGYAREPGRIETMLTNMFAGLPPGNYDRILDVSTAVTGGLFFVPSADLLDRIGSGEALAAPEQGITAFAGRAQGSLGIGSLKQGS